MKPLSRLYFCCPDCRAFMAGGWLFLAFFDHLSYDAALWSAVPWWRLLLRFCFVLAVLFYAVMHYIGSSVRNKEWVRINKADNGSLFGDPKSASKSRRLLYHSMRLATMLHMHTRDKNNLRLLCYCYDIGLIGVPRAVLEKDAPLSKEEQRELDRHLDLGAEIAAEIPRLRKVASLIACHEEHFNGGGAKAMYGRSIPLACRVFSVALMYDHYTQIYAGGRVLTTAEALERDGVLPWHGTGPGCLRCVSPPDGGQQAGAIR